MSRLSVALSVLALALLVPGTRVQAYNVYDSDAAATERSLSRDVRLGQLQVLGAHNAYNDIAPVKG
jgi:hypothetical protein